MSQSEVSKQLVLHTRRLTLLVGCVTFCFVVSVCARYTRVVASIFAKARDRMPTRYWPSHLAQDWAWETSKSEADMESGTCDATMDSYLEKNNWRLSAWAKMEWDESHAHVLKFSGHIFGHIFGEHTSNTCIACVWGVCTHLLFWTYWCVTTAVTFGRNHFNLR
jgi:hypothetical protein